MARPAGVRRLEREARPGPARRRRREASGSGGPRPCVAVQTSGELDPPPHTHTRAPSLSRMDCPPPAAPRPPAGDHAGRALRHQPPFSTRQFRGAQAWCDTPSWKPPEPPPCSPPSLPALLRGSRARPRAARASASACATPSPARGLCPRSQGCFGPRDPVWVLLASGLSLPPAVCGLPAAPTRAPPFPRSASAPGLQGAALRGPPSAGCCLPVSRAPC